MLLPLSVSSIFRKDQTFFKSYGGFYRRILKNFSYFFVPELTSRLRLLKSIGITNCQRSGDTRFDRVYQIVKQSSEVTIAKNFKANQKVFVDWQQLAGRSRCSDSVHQRDKMKFIIAPHETTEANILSVERSVQVKAIRYSQAAEKNLEDYQVLIID